MALSSGKCKSQCIDANLYTTMAEVWTELTVIFLIGCIIQSGSKLLAPYRFWSSILRAGLPTLALTQFNRENFNISFESVSHLDSCVLMSAKSFSTQNESSYDDSSDSDDDMESSREPIQLFGSKCENWDDVHAVLKEHSEQPELLDKFLVLYRIHVE